MTETARRTGGGDGSGWPRAWTALSWRHRVVAILAVGMASAIAAGVLHTAILAVLRHAFGRIVFFPREFVWMSPIAYGLAMLPWFAAFTLLAAVVRHQVVYRLAVTTAVTTAVFGVLLPFTQISRFAALLLALGVGVQIGHVASRRPHVWLARWRRVTLFGAAGVILLAISTPLVNRLGQRRAVAALPATGDDAPNVLLIILDTVRAASMGLFGGPPNTPLLAEWARQGVVFDFAVAPAPWTLPSHASMFTGRDPNRLSTGWTTPLDRRDSTLAEALRARGYVTGGFVANMHYTSYDSGLDRGFVFYEDYSRTWRQILLCSSYTQTALYHDLRRAQSPRAMLRAVAGRDLWISPKHVFAPKRGADISARFLEWQQALGERKFFAFLNYMDAHQPYFAPPQFRRFPAATPGLANYLAAIAYLDFQVDSVLATLRRRGVLDNTLVIVTSDHGELFGVTRGLRGHAHNVYARTLHVPLILRYPGRVPGGVRVPEVVSLTDIAATVLDMSTGSAAPVAGASLARWWAGGQGARRDFAFAYTQQGTGIEPVYPSVHGPLYTLLDDSLQYIRNSRGDEELFAYRSDSAAERNLARQPEWESALASRRAMLEELLKAPPR